MCVWTSGTWVSRGVGEMRDSSSRKILLSDFIRRKKKSTCPVSEIWSSSKQYSCSWYIILEPKASASPSGGGHLPSFPFSTLSKQFPGPFQATARGKDRILALMWGKPRQQPAFWSKESQLPRRKANFFAGWGAVSTRKRLQSFSS